MYREVQSVAGIFFGLVLLGCALHWFIHRFKFVTEKSWAILSAWLIYTVLLVVMTLFRLVFGRVPPPSGQWPHCVIFTILTLSMLLVFFANATFILNLLWWIIAFGLSLGIGFHVVVDDQHTTQTTHTELRAYAQRKQAKWACSQVHLGQYVWPRFNLESCLNAPLTHA